ncbi:MAG: hypothetical protein HYX90_03610 [Chloroflexi bacterium]|nr:hypothetical protein [Chloroflexota bacterium]
MFVKWDDEQKATEEQAVEESKAKASGNNEGKAKVVTKATDSIPETEEAVETASEDVVPAVEEKTAPILKKSRRQRGKAEVSPG